MKAHVKLLQCAILLAGLAWAARCCFSAAYGDELESEVLNFACTNEPVSRAIHLLSEGASIPINTIIDDVEEPRVSVAHATATVGEILQEILRPMTNYGVVRTRGTILVLPKGLEQDVTFPLNRVLETFEVTCKSYNTKSGEVFRCEFEVRPGASLNVALGFLRLTKRPSFQKLPAVMSFTNTTLLTILSNLATNMHQSWSCGRMHPGYVERRNKQAAKRADARTWWLNTNAPCYTVRWGQGAFHGDDGIDSLSQRANDEAQKHWLRATVFNEAMASRLNSKTKPPVRLDVIVSRDDAPGITNLWLWLQLTNISTDPVSIPNPFIGDVDRALWRVVRVVQDAGKGGYGAYDVQLPALDVAKEPQEIALAPQEVYKRSVNIRGATMTLDGLTTDNRFTGPKVEKLEVPGRYTLIVSLYFKDRNGTAYYIGPTGVEVELPVVTP